MRLVQVLPALLLVLAVSGCGDDGSDADSAPKESPQAGQAAKILECTSKQGLPGSIGQIEGGIPAIDLSTDDETILVHVLGSDSDAAAYENGADLPQEQVGNAVILGGDALTPEHRAAVKRCIEDSESAS